MKKILVLAVALLVVSFSNLSAETVTKKIDLKTSLDQSIERAEKLTEYFEEMQQYNLEYSKWQKECREIDEKHYKAQAKFQKANVKRLKKVKKMNEAKDAIDNASTREARLAANDRYKSLSKQLAKFKLPEMPKRPEYPEAPKRPEYPKKN